MASSIYSWDLFVRVCELIEAGNSLRSACAFKGMPPVPTFRGWVVKDEKHSERYARARRIMLDAEAEKLLELCDEPCLDNVEVQQLRLRVDTRKWLLAKLHPEYLDRSAVQHEGKMTLNVVTGVPEPEAPPKKSKRAAPDEDLLE